MPSPSQPETLTFPMLQIGAPESPGAYIHQSVPILEYLEDRFPEPDMRGATPELRAKGRDMLGVLDEATGWLGLYMHQSRQLFVPLEKQFAVVANVGLEKMHKQLDLLEREADVG
ncbi:MAG: hypothetical protein M1834_007429 [Cirrosporium novae-zelandiae]|nr:MAG: hypothetical protein M1834_007429 [Cirrosporium novae-zelandiae]